MRFVVAVLMITGYTVVCQAGDSISVALGTNTFKVRAVKATILEVSFMPTDLRDSATPAMSPGFKPEGKFTYNDYAANPQTVGTSSYLIKFYQSPFSFKVTDAQNNQLLSLAGPTDISTTSLRVSLPRGSWYGVTDNGPVADHNRADAWPELRFTGSKQIATSRMHGCADASFLWTTAGLGLLFDSDNGTFVIDTVANMLTVSRGDVAQNGNRKAMVFYLILGTPREIMNGYYYLTGFPPMPPRWVTGFTNSEWGINQAELLRILAQYRQKDVPIDCYVLDMDWGGYYDWNAANFPGAKSGALKDSLNRYGINLLTIRKQPECNTSDPACRANMWGWYMAVKPNIFETGVSGIWNDCSGEGFPYSYTLMARAQYDGLRTLNNKRVYTLNGNYLTGSHRYGYAHWTGDSETEFVTMAAHRYFLLGSSMLGASWWSMDIPGFTGVPSDELYYRWMQFGAFVPIYRIHGYENLQRQPWAFGAEAEAIATKYIRLRYTLMPYTYAAYWQLHRNGVPVARPFLMDYPSDKALANYAAGYMFGKDLAVYPCVTPGATSVNCYLPAGDWCDFWTDAACAGGQSVRRTIAHDEIPVFVKKGAVIPRCPYGNNTGDPRMSREITFHIYSGAQGSCEFVEDDGLTYAYETGANALITYDHTSSAGLETVSIGGKTGSYAPVTRTGYFTFHGIPAKPSRVVAPSGEITQPAVAWENLATAAAPCWSYNEALKQACVKVANPFEQGTVSLAMNGVANAGTGDLRGPACSSRRSAGVTWEVIDHAGRIVCTVRAGNEAAFLTSINAQAPAGLYIIRRQDYHAMAKPIIVR